jgi:hypothetical protein
MGRKQSGRSLEERVTIAAKAALAAQQYANQGLLVEPQALKEAEREVAEERGQAATMSCGGARGPVPWAIGFRLTPLARVPDIPLARNSEMTARASPQ